MDYKLWASGLTLLLLSQYSKAATTETELRVIVKYKTPVFVSSSVKQTSKQLQLPVKSLQPLAGDAWLLFFSSKDLKSVYPYNANKMHAVLQKLRKNPLITYAVQDRAGHFNPLLPMHGHEAEFTLSHELQWDEFKAPGGIMLESSAGLRDGAWAITSGFSSTPVVVAVLDTGIALNNSLVGNLVKNPDGEVFGWNFSANNRNLGDETDSWHGTHVAGTIAAFGEVMLGVGEHLKILPVKIPDKSGMFYESQVINAIYWSVGGRVPGVPDNLWPAKVLNMSFGIDEGPGKEMEHCDEALLEALNFVREAGAVITVAAGNDNRWEHYNAPAACNGTIKVAATGPSGLRARYSNYGPGVSFAAPGGDLHYGKKGGILSTVNPEGGYGNTGFDFYQGTSMASPHAAGVAGLIYAVSDAAIAPERVEQILYATTHDFGKTNDANVSCVGIKPCGSGILDAANAVKAALAKYDEIITAPGVDELFFTDCSHGEVQIQASDLTFGKWRMLQGACQIKEHYQQPILTQSSDGEIVAQYGNMRLKMESSHFRHCEIIGSHGVGCHK